MWAMISSALEQASSSLRNRSKDVSSASRARLTELEGSEPNRLTRLPDPYKSSTLYATVQSGKFYGCESLSGKGAGFLVSEFPGVLYKLVPAITCEFGG